MQKNILYIHSLENQHRWKGQLIGETQNEWIHTYDIPKGYYPWEEFFNIGFYYGSVRKGCMVKLLRGDSFDPSPSPYWHTQKRSVDRVFKFTFPSQMVYTIQIAIPMNKSKGKIEGGFS